MPSLTLPGLYAGCKTLTYTHFVQSGQINPKATIWLFTWLEAKLHILALNMVFETSYVGIFVCILGM